MNEAIDVNRWLVQGHCPDRRLQLFCFSYAGGDAAVFHPWQAELGPEVQVCAVRLPGRGARFCEAPCTALDTLVPVIAAVVATARATPFWFFGHSMGALLAFEVARHLAARGQPQPAGLFVSGCEAPGQRRRKRLRAELDDDALIQVLGEFNGVPAEVLRHRELMKMLLPMVRADLTMVETYAYAAGPRLALPIDVLAGTADPHVDHDAVAGWAGETTAACRVQWFEGDHFFINSARAAVIRHVLRRLLPAARATATVDA